MSASLSVVALVLALLPKPDAAPGWTRREPPRSYGPQGLYRYMDGAADLYLGYGFEELAVGDYVKSGEDGHWITVDIYNMGAPLHAFGIYGAEKPPWSKPFLAGAQAYSSDGLIAFWQGGYYVKVMLIEGEDMCAATALARSAAEGLPGPAEMPAELKRLPAEGRLRDSERYIKKGALGHSFLVEVISASYQVGDATAALHIADVGTPEKAVEGWRELREFEAGSGGRPAELAGVGEECFAARDPYYGEMVAARVQRFLVIAMSEKSDRAALTSLIERSLPALRPKVETGACQSE